MTPLLRRVLTRLWVFLLMGSWGALGDQTVLYHQGQSFGAAGIAVPSGVSADKVPGYAGTDVSEAHLDADELEEAAQQRLSSGTDGSAAEVLVSTSRTRGQFPVTAKDPLLTRSNDVVQNPEKYVGAFKKEERLAEKTLVTQHRCQTSPSMTVEVEEKIVVKPVLLKEIVESGTRTHGWDCDYFGWWHDDRRPGPEATMTRKTHHRYFDGINWFDKYTDTYHTHRLRQGTLNPETGELTTGPWQEVSQEVYEAAQGADGHEGWQAATPGAEVFVAQNACQVVSHQCLEGPATRTVNGLSVFKPCWRRETVYECHGPRQNGCQHLMDRGCAQISSKCVQTEKGRCVVFENLYDCTDKHRQLARTSLEGDVPYCLDGNCADTGYAANEDMAEVLSKLAIFRELQKDMSALEATVFKGTQDFCDKHVMGFSDCCQKAGGWGSRLKMTKCKKEELALAKKREKKKCVFVGTFCVEKLPVIGTCLRKRSHYCCFASKLARIVQEQGRRQLGLDFGSAKHPKCRALSIHELAQLDFSKIDLQELFDDLTSTVSVPDPSKVVTSFKEAWQHRLPGVAEDVPLQNTMKARYKSRKQKTSVSKGQYTLNHQDHHPDPKSEIVATQEGKLVF